MNAYSPYLALFTGLIEIFAFIYFFLLFKQSGSHLKSITSILFFLGTYQLLEAFNCMFPGHSFLVRLSFADITILPALGVYFAYLSSPKESKTQRYITFAFLSSALFFITYFLSKPTSAVLLSCQQFFATYYHADILYQFYGLYYQLGLFTMLIMAVRNMVFTPDLRKRQLIGNFVIGSVVFIIPSILITAFLPTYQGSMPSVMCHIAIFFSFFIVKALLNEKRIRQLSLDLELSHLNMRL
ncbi:MAG: hypothetical protein DRI74_07145 [Bacteroidetes bacterium]|nr:MAG: hypothetical protein DRI74_07145 [Bacteroidota bacterium]